MTLWMAFTLGQFAGMTTTILSFIWAFRKKLWPPKEKIEEQPGIYCPAYPINGCAYEGEHKCVGIVCYGMFDKRKS